MRTYTNESRPPETMNLAPLVYLGAGLAVAALQLWNGLVRQVRDAYAVPELE